MSTIKLRHQAQPTSDGDGVKIQRNSLVRQPLADPWLLLDELVSENPKDFIGGFPPHPHRGIQTISIMLKGGFEHQDHLGNKGAITAGGVQWMSAGRGIEHSEMPINSEQGLHGFQLWLNLSAAEKMSAPDWRDVQSNEIPELQIDSGAVRIIAGQWDFASEGEGGRLDNVESENKTKGEVKVEHVAKAGEIEKPAPLQNLPGDAAIAHLEINPGATFSYHAKPEEQLLFYIFAGNSADADNLQAQQMLFLGEGGELDVIAGEKGLSGLLLKGVPHKEPIANWGPFVMNHPEEIEQAIREYRDGTFL